jgi:hypothetical protein
MGLVLLWRVFVEFHSARDPGDNPGSTIICSLVTSAGAWWWLQGAWGETVERQ